MPTAYRLDKLHLSLWEYRHSRMARFFIFLILLIPVSAWAVETRVALVIGNSAYKDAPLSAPTNDVRAMKIALTELGFKVTALENVGRESMRKAIRTFIEELSSSETVSLFYFAGHGLQAKGKNYLIPVDAQVEHEDDIQFQGIDVQYILDKYEEKRNGMNILILDACRSNPFTRRGVRGTSGLAAVDGPPGTLVAFAAAPGKVAIERTGGNGIYTKNVLANIRQPGLPVEEVFKRVRTGVLSESGGIQVPWENTSLVRDFYFKGAQAGSGFKPANTDSEADAWAQVSDSRNIYDLVGFLRRFPDSRYRKDLLERVNAILGRMKPAPPAIQLDELPSLLNEVYAGFQFRLLNKYSSEYFGLPEKTGILVSDVERGSAAERAGLIPGDILLRVNGRPINTQEDALALSKTILPGELVEGDFLRNKTEIRLSGIVPRAPIEFLLLSIASDALRAKRYDRARIFSEYLASIDYANGQSFLGQLYLFGLGVPRNFQAAEHWLAKAATQGKMLAAAFLATIYLNPNSGIRNDTDAFKWAKRSAEAGVPEGATMLSIAFVRGVGTEKNPFEAVRWARIAAEQGQLTAILVLAAAHEAGAGGLSKNIDQAKALYKRAADGGLPQAREALRRLGE